MPRIHTVAQDGTITAGDKLIGSDGDPNNGYVTRNYTVGGISNYVLGGTNAGLFTTITTTGNGTIGGNLSVTGDLSVTGNATIAGNLTFGDADTDTVSFSADVNSHVIPDVTNTYDLGASDKIWRNIYADNVEGYLKSADAAATYLALAGGTLTGALIGTTATFTGDIQLGDATTDAASEIKAYGDLGLRADSDNDTGYSRGVEIFRTRFDMNGFQIHLNKNLYDENNNLVPDTAFATIEVGDVVYGLGNYGVLYQNNTSEAITSVDGWYDSSNNFVHATDSTGAAYFRLTVANGISYAANAYLTILPAGETFVSGGGASSIKFYADTTTIGTLNESLFSIPGKATIGAFTIPNTIGTAEQVLKVPSSGSELQWGDININGYTFPSAAGTAGQVLKIPSSGTQLEWANDLQSAASAVIGSGTNAVSSSANDFAVNINSTTGGMTIVTNDGATGGPNFRMSTNTIQSAFILEYDQADNTVVMQRHGSEFLVVENNLTRFKSNNLKIGVGTQTNTHIHYDDLVIDNNQDGSGIQVISNDVNGGKSTISLGKSTRKDGAQLIYDTQSETVRVVRNGSTEIEIDNFKINFYNRLRVTGLYVYADETAAAAGGLVTGDLYRTTTGEVRIKL